MITLNILLYAEHHHALPNLVNRTCTKKDTLAPYSLHIVYKDKGRYIFFPTPFTTPLLVVELLPCIRRVLPLEKGYNKFLEANIPSNPCRKVLSLSLGMETFVYVHSILKSNRTFVMVEEEENLAFATLDKKLAIMEQHIKG